MEDAPYTPVFLTREDERGSRVSPAVSELINPRSSPSVVLVVCAVLLGILEGRGGEEEREGRKGEQKGEKGREKGERNGKIGRDTLLALLWKFPITESQALARKQSRREKLGSRVPQTAREREANKVSLRRFAAVWWGPSVYHFTKAAPYSPFCR